MIDHVGLSTADCRWPGYTAIIKETNDLVGTPFIGRAGVANLLWCCARKDMGGC
jgi:hypothetical protein